MDDGFDVINLVRQLAEIASQTDKPETAARLVALADQILTAACHPTPRLERSLAA